MLLTPAAIDFKRRAIERILKVMKAQISEVDPIAVAMGQQCEKLTVASQGLDLFVYMDGERYSRWQLLVENLQFMTDACTDRGRHPELRRPAVARCHATACFRNFSE